MKPSYEELERRIAELEKREQDYKNSLDKYAVLFNQNPDGIAIIDAQDSIIVEFNEQLCRQLGYTHEEMINLRISDFELIESDEDTRRHIENIINYGEDHFETRHKTKNGDILDIFVIVHHIKIGDRNLLHSIFRDITEKKSYESKLLESQIKLRTIFENSNDALYLVHNNGFIIDANYQAELLTGLNKRQLMNNHIWNIQYDLLLPILKSQISVDMIKEVWENQISLLNDDDFLNFDGSIQSNDGNIRFVEDFVRPLIIDNTRYYFVSQRDVSERKKSEEAIKHSEEKYKSIFQNNHSIMMILEPHTGKIRDANPAACKFYGWTREELLTMKASDINILSEEEVKKEMQKAVLEERNHFQFRHRLASGEIRNVEVSSGLITVENEDLLYSIIHDISDRVLAESKLKESERKLKLFVEHAPAAIAMFDNNMVYLAASQRYLEDFNLKEVNIVGRSHYELFPEMGEERIAIHKRCLAGASEKSDEDRLVRMDGSIEFVRWELYPWYENDDKIGGLLFFSEVFTERKKAEDLLKESENNLRVKNFEYEKLNNELVELNQQLLAAKDKAEESDRLKSAFLQNISHEVRTPLNGIMGFSKLLKLPGLTHEEIDEYTDLILNSGDRLLETVNNILDMALIQTNQLKVNKRKIVLESVITDVYECNEEKAKTKGINLRYSLDNMNDHYLVNTDQIRLNQVLNNLVNNAIKFTIEGTVEFGYDVKDNFFEFFVKDSGIGISPNLGERIFQRFAQVEVSISRNYEGNGLGLSICKGLVELLGGKIWFESQLGKGTSFYFTIPIQ